MRVISRRLRCISSDIRGATALEFAFVAPLAIALQLGTIYVSLMVFSQSALEYAVSEAARCASVMTSLCNDNNSTRIYARRKYLGLGNPTFNPRVASCGNLVTASMSFSWTTGSASYNTPLSASACFPL